MLMSGISRMCDEDSSCREKRTRAVSAFQETMTEAATNPAKYQCRRVAEPEISCIFSTIARPAYLSELRPSCKSSDRPVRSRRRLWRDRYPGLQCATGRHLEPDPSGCGSSTSDSHLAEELSTDPHRQSDVTNNQANSSRLSGHPAQSRSPDAQ